jgi:hypothetical protein
MPSGFFLFLEDVGEEEEEGDEGEDQEVCVDEENYGGVVEAPARTDAAGGFNTAGEAGEEWEDLPGGGADEWDGWSESRDEKGGEEAGGYDEVGAQEGVAAEVEEIFLQQAVHLVNVTVWVEWGEFQGWRS